MATLSYYFDNETSVYYENVTNILNSSDNKTSGSGVSIPITLINHSNSITMSIKNSESIAKYYTLNKIFLSGTSYFSTLNPDKTISQTIPNNSNYQLIIQGNLNDSNNNLNNTNNQILIILPIFTNVSDTIQGNNNSVTNLNNSYLNELLNISIGHTNNIVNGFDINNFLSGTTSANLYTNVSNNNIIYTIVQFKKTNLWANITLPTNIKLTNLFIPSTTPDTISVLNNGTTITTSIANDIYIDCSPTNNLGEKVDVYSSKNLDQLNLFKINDVEVIYVWGAIILSLAILGALIFCTFKILGLSGTDGGGIFNLTKGKGQTTSKL